MTQERNIEAALLRVLRLKYPDVRIVKILLMVGWPDRLVLLGRGRHIWLELKTPVGELSPAQRAVHRVLRGLGEDVYVPSGVREALDIIGRHHAQAKRTH